MEFKKQILKTKVCASGQPPDSSTAQTACRPCSDRESARPLSLILPSNHPNQIDKKESTTLPSTSTSGSKHREASTEPWPEPGKTRSRSFACSASTTKTIARPKRSHPTPETTHPHTAREAFPAAATRPTAREPRPIGPRAFLLSFALPFSARGATLHSNNTHLSAPPLLLPLPPATSRRGLASPRRLRHFRNTTSATAMVTATARPRRGPGPR